MQFFKLSIVRRVGWPKENKNWITQLAKIIFFSYYLFTASSFAGSHLLTPQFSPVTPNVALTFPHDFGAHPDFRTEWWYVTGWLETPDKKPLGFQITFFRVATAINQANPSRFAPKQLIIAHAALSDPSIGKLLHDQKKFFRILKPPNLTKPTRLAPRNDGIVNVKMSFNLICLPLLRR